MTSAFLNVMNTEATREDILTALGEFYDKNAKLRLVLEKVLSIGQGKCPCFKEYLDPCPLCGALAASGTCLAVHTYLPNSFICEIEEALKS